MTKRFTDDGAEAIVDQSFTDNLTKKTYYVDYFDEIVDLLNELDEKYVDEFSLRETLQQELQRVENENEQLKIKLEDIALDMENAKEFNDDAQYELYKIKKENEQLKSVLKEIVRVSEYNGAISPMRVKSMTYNFIGDLND